MPGRADRLVLLCSRYTTLRGEPVELSEQSLEDQETQDSKALAKTKSEREEFATATTATES